MESKKSFHFSFIFFFFSPRAMKAQSFNHWIIREVPRVLLELQECACDSNGSFLEKEPVGSWPLPAPRPMLMA